MDRLIVVFGTTAIMSDTPVYAGQQPVYVHGGCSRHRYRAYSTGKLESALAQLHDVYVCTVIPLFRPEDAWWRELVPPDRIYRPIADAHGTPDQSFDHFIIDPWRRFFRDLGRAWPENVEDALEWRKTLDGSDGILYGGRIQGFSGIAA